MKQENPFKTINERILRKFIKNYEGGAVGFFLRRVGILVVTVLIAVYGAGWAVGLKAWPGVPMLFGSLGLAVFVAWYLKEVSEEFEKDS